MHSAASGTNLLTKIIHYRKYLSNLIAGIILIFEITACQSLFSPKTPPTPTPNPPSWFTDWLNDPVCQPPCWQGITPGKTTFTETQKILSELPWLKINFGPGKLLPGDSGLTLEWKAVAPPSGSGIAFSDDQKDLTIMLGFGGTLSAKLKEVIDKYGDPSHVYIAGCHAGLCDIELIYLSTGMMIQLILQGPDWGSYLKVSPDSEITQIQFFPPGEDGFSAAFPADAERFQTKGVPWVGYSKYKVLQ